MDKLLYLFAKDRHVTELIYPAGLEYKRLLDVFGIVLENGKRFIRSAGGLIEWDSGGELRGLETAMYICTPTDVKAAIATILGRMYGDNCHTF